MTDDDSGAAELGIEKSEYNTIFEKFVDSSRGGQGLVLGLVAYGIYKHAKREWASSIRRSKGRGPSPDELEAYVSSWTPGRIDGARTEARQVLAEYADDIISEEEPRILRDAVRGSFWSSVLRSLAASALYTIILIVLLIIVTISGVDLLEIFKTIKVSSEG